MSGRSSRQLPLALPHRPAMSRADFLVGEANAAAIALVDRWPEWPRHGVFLAGPVGSGKSHLVEIFCAASGAERIAAAGLDPGASGSLAEQGAVAIEDVHVGPVDERALFHLLNLATERRTAVLLTSRTWPSALPFGIADLASRLRAAQLVELAEPDDDLLRRLLIKLFADRQLAVDPPVVDFIAVRIERSLAAANRIVDELDREALAEGRAITRQLVSAVLGEAFPAEDED